MAERIIPFPFQKKEINDGEKLPLVDHVLEESKTVDKWQIVGGIALVPVLGPVAVGAAIGFSIVSHEVTRGELSVRRAKRLANRNSQNLPKAA